ncbi:hypothetical protein [Fusibacter sp. JL216-2]|uniref:hypothetical protein n=1 Tax=Fusibacter sp. JL216-2 TaxID=3071453 RepID=UPI003D33A388
MKNSKKIIALMLLLVMVVSSGTMAFASNRKKISSNFMYNYSYRQYRVDGEYEWSLKIPNHPTVDVQGNNKNAIHFKDELNDFEDNYDAFKRLAKPSKKLKESDPKEYEDRYVRYKVMRAVLLDYMDKTDANVLGDEEELRYQFYKYWEKHYSHGRVVNFYGDDVDYALTAGRCISCCIDYYSYLD